MAAFFSLWSLETSLFLDGFVGSVNLLELLLGGLPHLFSKVGDQVRMVFLSHLTVGFLHFLVGGRRLDAENLISAVCFLMNIAFTEAKSLLVMPM